jgi:LPS O-antigen subunit length determinant protein (WzzB/FepE family)
MKQDIPDQINLFEVFLILWGEKFKIMGFILISVVLMIGYQAFKVYPQKVITEITPINFIQDQQYRLLNAEFNKLNSQGTKNNSQGTKNNSQGTKNNSQGTKNPIFEDLTKINFLNYFIQTLNEKNVFEKEIHNFKLLDINEYKDQKAYDSAVNKLAPLIKIIPPTDLSDDKKNEGIYDSYWSIEFETTNTKKWKKILSAVNDAVNQDIQKFIGERFKTSISIINLKKKFDKIELEVDIKNALDDYSRDTEERIAFLNEQAKIARELDIARNTLQTVKKETKDNNTVSTIQTDAQFYMNGYIPIEEEIKNILNRDNNSLFVKNLKDLERSKRKLEQDQTVKRLTELFSLTPVANNTDKFEAAFIQVNASIVKQKNKLLELLLAALVGGLIGFIYVLLPVINPKQNK